MEWRPFDVTVISAQGIKNVNYFSTMDVYVEVSIVGYAKNTKRTFIDKRGGTSPKWNHPMKFTLDEPSLTKPGLSLYFRLRSDRLFGDKDIGIVSIPINEIFGQSASGPDGSAERIVEYQVFTPISGRPRGTLKFSYKFGKKYGQPSEPMFKNANQPNGMYNENKHGDVPVTAYPYSQTGSNNVPPGMGYGMSNMAYQQPVGYPPAGYNGQQPTGYPPAGQNGGYPPAGYSPSGYGYPPQQHQQSYGGGYPQVQQVQKPQKKSNFGGMGAGVGLGLAGGLLGGMLVGELASDVGEMDAYDQGYDDAMDDMDF
ncbi:protein SRC2-like [Nicotiana sylvestris]|uniref:Calcium-binding protein P-like n=1 Tax=Nicotiana sylvestris TaxID=4096 RepID=A0A1U7W530_NICSY|nr:PREDICTED: calcium-binding protein P-like [Nicotiana sylvestris]